MSQLKIKNGNSWEAIPAGGVGVPSGGSSGQYLKKSSNTDYATEWATLDPGDKLILPYATDLNTYGGRMGIYAFMFASTSSNRPADVDGVVLQIRTRDDSLMQLAFSGWDARMWYRRQWGTSWQGWTQLRNN